MADANNRLDEGTVRERVQELTWAMVDERIDSGEVELLDSLLLSDDAARETYLDCVRLHVDLVHFFAETQTKKAAGTSTPVMGFLGGATPPTEFQPPVAERN